MHCDCIAWYCVSIQDLCHSAHQLADVGRSCASEINSFQDVSCSQRTQGLLACHVCAAASHAVLLCYPEPGVLLGQASFASRSVALDVVPQPVDNVKLAGAGRVQCELLDVASLVVGHHTSHALLLIKVPCDV